MKRRKTPSSQIDELMPLVVQQWRKISGEGGPDDRLQTREFRTIVEKIKKMRAGEGFDLGAYLLYYYPLHYLEALSLLGELPYTPERVLDLASGAGPAALAALQWGAGEVVAFDRNRDLLRIGGNLSGKMGFPLSMQAGDAKSKLPFPKNHFDLIIVSHALFEMEVTFEWIEMLLGLLTERGFLLLIDSSLPEPNKQLLTFRNEAATRGIPIQAPCVWRGECPALKQGFACYAQREYEKHPLLREFQRAAEINLSSLKMSYLILRSNLASQPTLPERELFRVVSQPFQVAEGKRFYLCGTPGLRALIGPEKDIPQPIRAFEYLRRGDLLSVEGARCHGKEIEIGEESRLKVESACGKPLPNDE